MSARIRVEGLSKTFVLAEHGGVPPALWQALRTAKPEPRQRVVRAIEDVSFEIREGERVGIIGRNGAGKTTLLSIIAGISEPTEGRVEIEGNLHAMLTIGAVVRDEATGRENIYLDGAVNGRSEAEIAAHVEEIVAFAELGEFIDRPVRTYSTGMKGRLAFAMSVTIEPDVLIIDETLAVGDFFFADKAMRRMRELTAKGRIVILVSHSLGAIEEMCNRCLWLEHGRLVMDGPPKEVTAAYLKSVQQADEAQLRRKFERGDVIVRHAELGRITDVMLAQNEGAVAITVAAFKPLSITIRGEISGAAVHPDLSVAMTRVDGRRIWEERLSTVGFTLLPGPFTVTATLDPLILGSALYRVDATIIDAGGPVDAVTRVVEIIDEEGQRGGVPLLFYPPIVTSRRIKEIST